MAANVFSFDSIGTTFWIERLDGKEFGPGLQRTITEYAQNFDDTYSRFKDASLIGQLAQTGVLKHPTSELRAMLDYSRRMYEVSDGAFNITVGATLHRLGYGRRVHGGDVLVDPWGAVQWSSKKVSVPQGLMLDFGGFGKGWLIDKIGVLLRHNGVTRFIVNGGGDIFVQNSEPIEFALEDPKKPGRTLQTVKIAHGALAGSDTVKRSWDDGGARKHHIIDPRRNDSAHTPVLASYVLAPTALIADTLATIVIIRPSLKPKLTALFNADISLITN